MRSVKPQRGAEGGVGGAVSSDAPKGHRGEPNWGRAGLRRSPASYGAERSAVRFFAEFATGIRLVWRACSAASVRRRFRVDAPVRACIRKG